MGVIAKFRCQERKEICWGAGSTVGAGDPKPDQITVKLAAVYAEDGPNKAWAEATPDGQIEMTISNPDAWPFFVAGQEYTVEFRKAQPQKARTGDENEDLAG